MPPSPVVKFIFYFALLPLAACSVRHDKDDDGKDETKAEIRIGGGNESGETHGGKFSLKIPGFSGSIDVPESALDTNNGSDHVQIGGVPMFPGTRVGGVNIDAGDKDKDGTVMVTFTASAPVDAVRDYYASAFAKDGQKVSVNGDRLSGTTDEGTEFVIDLKPQGNGTSGTMKFVSHD